MRYSAGMAHGPLKHFEDFHVGDRTVLGPHAVTREEILEFARRWDPQPFHLDEAAAEASVFQGLTAPGCLVVAITVSLLTTQPVRVAVLAALGWDEVRFLGPVRPGDALSIVHECIEVKESRSKPDRGVVKNRITALNGRGEAVLTYVDTILVAKAGG